MSTPTKTTCTNLAHPKAETGPTLEVNGLTYVALTCQTCNREQGRRLVRKPLKAILCLKEFGGFGACIKAPQHEGDCRDANGRTFVGERRTTMAEYLACGKCDRCKMDADVPAGRGWSDCGRSGKPSYLVPVQDARVSVAYLTVVTRNSTYVMTVNAYSSALECVKGTRFGHIWNSSPTLAIDGSWKSLHAVVELATTGHAGEATERMQVLVGHQATFVRLMHEGDTMLDTTAVTAVYFGNPRPEHIEARVAERGCAQHDFMFTGLACTC